MNGTPADLSLDKIALSGKPRLIRPKAVIGPRLKFRDARPEDAAFILSLRLDPSKNKYLSETRSDEDAQRRWLELYATDASQVYFIIEASGTPVGTVRLYNQKGHSFCWGSWILSDDAPKSSAVESTLMVYHYGMMELQFSASHFEVRKANTKVWRYHERLGAERLGETEQDYLYSITKPAVLKAFERYAERLPHPIMVEWE